MEVPYIAVEGPRAVKEISLDLERYGWILIPHTLLHSLYAGFILNIKHMALDIGVQSVTMSQLTLLAA